MRRETNNDRQQRLFVTGLLISAVVGALIGLLWPLWWNLPHLSRGIGT